MTVISKQMLKQEIDRLDSDYLELVYKILQQFPHDPTSEKTSLSGSEIQEKEEVTSSNPEVSTTNNEVMSHFQASLEKNYRLGELLAK